MSDQPRIVYGAPMPPKVHETFEPMKFAKPTTPVDPQKLIELEADLDFLIKAIFGLSAQTEEIFKLKAEAARIKGKSVARFSVE